MTDKPTPTDAELEALLLDKLPASKHYIRPVIEKMVAAMQAAIDKCGQPAQKTVTVVPATGDVWLKHDDDLRYVRRVLEAGRQMTDVDQRAAIDIVQGLRVTARSMAVDAKKPAQAAEPVAWAATSEDGDVEALGMNQSRRFDTPLYTAPQPTHAQAGAVPLDEARRMFDAGWKAAALFCDREDVAADGIIGFGASPQFEAAFSAAQGIKGGQP